MNKKIYSIKQIEKIVNNNNELLLKTLRKAIKRISKYDKIYTK